MESPGIRLKKLRLEKGLSLEEVHKRTKIHLNILKAIEEDTLVGFGPAYIKGFLKIYCKFLGVDPGHYIIEDSRKPETRPVFIPSPSQKQKQPVSYPFNFIKLKVVIISCSVLMAAVMLLALARFVSGRWNLYQKEKKASVKQKAGPSKSKIKETPKQPQGKAKDRTAVSSAAAQKQEQAPVGVDIRLGMRAREDCWVDLKVDGRVVFHGILRKAKFESWQAKEKIDFSLGNAGVVELELNGKIIPPLGRKGQSLKSVSVTKTEGLVIAR